MRHRKAGKKLSREKSARRALLRNLATDLVVKGEIMTTSAKGTVVSSYAEKLVTVAKSKPYLQAKSILQKKLFGKKAPLELLRVYRKRYIERSGGYTRILKMGRRSGDQAKQVKIIWV